MAQPKKNIKKSVNKGSKPAQAYSPKKAETSLFTGLDNWLNSKSSGITIAAFSICILFSLLLFQARMDTGGDDSGYILRAYDFVHKGVFPSYQGPLYPLVLSLFISMFGIKIIMLKFISVAFVFFALFFIYKTFKERLPALVFYPVLLLTAINAYILSFASLTYSEACFMFLQSLVLFYFFKLNDKLSSLEKFTLKDTYADFLLAALFVFLLSLSRSVGLFALPALLLFFLVRREFKYAGCFLGAFVVFYALTEFIKKVFLHVTAVWGAERSALMLKDQYNPSLGYENAAGFAARFKGNANLFLSKRFFQVIGLRSPDSTDVYPFLTFIFVVVCLFVLYRAIKSKNYYILGITLYTGSMLAATFLAVQTSIDQPRFVMVYVPLLLLMFLFAFYDSLKKSSWVGQSFVMLTVIILLIAGSVSLIKRTSENMTVLSKNMKGDMTYGFTPDWANYINMSKWCADNLPDGAKVATRKAEVSFIYTDKEIFFPVYKVTSANADSNLDFFKKNKVNYVMLASLRANAKVPDGNIITTLWRIMQPIAEKYPKKLRLVHQEGTAEPAYVYQIIY